MRRRWAVEALLLLFVALLTRAAIRTQAGDCVCPVLPAVVVAAAPPKREPTHVREEEIRPTIIVSSYVLLYVETGMAIVDTARLRTIFHFQESLLMEQILGGGIMSDAIVL
jgi:hypothetical protein